MASVYPAMRGKFGSTEYYLVTMKAGEVAKQLMVPKDMPGWDDLEPEERSQMTVNYNRVREQMAPYLAQDADRFLGALIVDVLNPENMVFEEAAGLLANVPGLYRASSQALGFLVLSGAEILVPLDGRHRLHALKFALTGKDEKQEAIPGLEPNADLANDDVLLMLVRHDPTRARRIFNHVKRQAVA